MEKSDRSKQELYRSYESLKLEIAKIQQFSQGKVNDQKGKSEFAMKNRESRRVP